MTKASTGEGKWRGRGKRHTRNIDLGLVRETVKLKSADEQASQFSEKSDRQTAGPAGTARKHQKACENLTSRNSLSFAVAELGDGFEFLERRGERIRKAPDRSRPEFVVFRLEVKVMYGSGKVFGSFQFTLHKCLVDDGLGGEIR